MEQAETRNRLNVVLITADDLNYTSVGYMGCPIPEITPNWTGWLQKALSLIMHT